MDLFIDRALDHGGGVIMTLRCLVFSSPRNRLPTLVMPILLFKSDYRRRVPRLNGQPFEVVVLLLEKGSSREVNVKRAGFLIHG
jgi:hypothetical protein